MERREKIKCYAVLDPDLGDDSAISVSKGWRPITQQLTRLSERAEMLSVKSSQSNRWPISE